MWICFHCPAELDSHHKGHNGKDAPAFHGNRGDGIQILKLEVFRNYEIGAGEMTQWLRAPTALPEDQN